MPSAYIYSHLKRHFGLDESDLIKVWVIAAFIIIALCTTIYSLGTDFAEASPYLVYLFPHLYYIPLILISIWYPRYGLQATILLVVAFLAISAYFSSIGTAVDPVLSTLNAALYIWVVAATTLLARQGGIFTTQYKRLLDNASAGIMLFNIESGRIMEANRTLSELLGYSDKEITALPAATLWADPAEKDLLFDRLKSGFAVINFESKFLSKSGEIRSLLISCKEIEFEKVFEFTLLDINALKGLESAIGNTQEYYRQTSGYPCNLTFLQDIEGCCYEIQWNDAEKYGIDTKRLLGKSLHDVMPAKEAVRYKECLNEVRDTRKPVECETTFTVNNREYFFSMRLLPLLDAAGSVTGFMGMCRDITDERGEREAKVQLEREIKHRRDFITTAAHELRTPLQPILGYLHLLLDDPDLYSLDAETTRILRMCLVNVERERRIVDRMLELSILYNGRIQIDLEYIPICNLVNTLIENGGYGTEANIENRIPEDVIMRVDGNCMYQVIETLVSNAIRYNTSPKSVWITYREDKTNHYLSVQDNGIGIEERALESIFKPFYLPDAANLSRQTNRMGLGLSIAREYIGLHGGDISVESHMGEGSTFTVRIPKEVPE